MFTVVTAQPHVTMRLGRFLTSFLVSFMSLEAHGPYEIPWSPFATRQCPYSRMRQSHTTHEKWKFCRDTGIYTWNTLKCSAHTFTASVSAPKGGQEPGGGAFAKLISQRGGQGCAESCGQECHASWIRRQHGSLFDECLLQIKCQTPRLLSKYLTTLTPWLRHDMDKDAESCRICNWPSGSLTDRGLRWISWCS
jgi:hypothetical protein